MAPGHLEQLSRPLSLLPQRGALVGIHAGHEQCPRRALAEAGREQGGAAHLFGDQVFQLVGLEHEQLCAGRLGLGIGDAHDDAVVARDRRPLDAEALTHPGVDRQRPGCVHLHAVGGMQDDTPVADLVATTFDGERAVGRERARRFALLGQVRHQVRSRLLVESGVDQSLRRLLGRGRRHLAGERAQSLAELERAADPVAVPERHLARLPVGRDHVDAVVGDLRDPPARRTEREHVAHPRLVDHLLVELADPRARRFAGDEDAEQAAVRDRAATGHRDPLCSRSPGQRAGIAIPHQSGAQLGELVGRESTGQQIERRLVGRTRKSLEGRRPANRLEPLLDPDGSEGARGDGLLREDVERVARHLDRLDLAREHPLGHDRGVQHVAAVLREERGATDLAHLVTGAAHPLQTGGRRGRCLDLDHEVDRSHVDAELEAARRDDAAQHAGLELFLDLRALLLRD